LPNGIEGSITGGLFSRGVLKARVFACVLMEIADNHTAEINSNTSVHSLSQECCQPNPAVTNGCSWSFAAVSTPPLSPYLDAFAYPVSEQPASEGLGVSAEALLQRLPANEAAILRLRVLQGQTLRAAGRELGICSMTVSRREKAALAALMEQLA
jgi:hypothetical protein